MIQAVIIFYVVFLVLYLGRAGIYFTAQLLQRPRPWYAKRKAVWILFDLCGLASFFLFWAVVIFSGGRELILEALNWLFILMLGLALLLIWWSVGYHFAHKMFGDDLSRYDRLGLSLYTLSFHGGLMTAIFYYMIWKWKKRVTQH